MLLIVSMYGGEKLNLGIKHYQNKNFDTAVYMFKEICEGKLSDNEQGLACQMLGELYEGGWANLQKNEFKAFNYYKQACKYNKKSCFQVGKAYTLGIGVTINNKLAVINFRKSCNAGFNDACKYAQ